MTIIETLAQYSADYQLEKTSQLIQTNAIAHITDTLGVMLAGVGEPSWFQAVSYAKRYGGTAESMIVGSNDQKTDPCNAAMINAIAAHTLDFDDMTSAFFGHPGIAILPALLASCNHHTTGRQFLEAFLVGAELCGALGAGIDWNSYGDQWVATSCIGVLGGAAAVAKLKGLSYSETVHALSIAVAEFSGLTGNYGTSAKDLNAGRGAAKSVFSVQMSQLGFSGSASILECYFSATGANFSSLQMEKALSSGSSIFIDPGVAMKKYPVCGSALNGIEAALSLSAQGITADTISRLYCLLPDVSMLNVTPPPTPQAGKFNLAYCICLALVQGDVRIEDFNHTAILNQKALQLMSRLDGKLDRSLKIEKAGIELIAECANRQPVSAKVEIASGDPAVPLTSQEQKNKFLNCACRRLSLSNATILYQRLSSLPNVLEISQILQLL